MACPVARRLCKRRLYISEALRSPSRVLGTRASAEAPGDGPQHPYCTGLIVYSLLSWATICWPTLIACFLKILGLQSVAYCMMLADATDRRGRRVAHALMLTCIHSSACGHSPTITIIHRGSTVCTAAYSSWLLVLLAALWNFFILRCYMLLFPAVNPTH